MFSLLKTDQTVLKILENISSTLMTHLCNSGSIFYINILFLNVLIPDLKETYVKINEADSSVLSHPYHMQKQKLIRSLNVFVPKINVQVPYTEDDLTTLAFCENTKLNSF